MKIVGLCAFRDAASYLPGLIENLGSALDCVIWADDGSMDGSAGIAESSPITLDILTRKRGEMFSHETENRALLLKRALAYGADWVLCMDADFRFEKRFLNSLEMIARDNEYTPVVWLKLRDLWNAENQYRVDGIWSHKTQPLLFRCVPFNEYHLPGTLHSQWVPPWMKQDALQSHTDWNVYHLGSLTPELRRQRVENFNRVDAAKHYQSDYSYLCDETGLQVEKICPCRGFQL